MSSCVTLGQVSRTLEEFSVEERPFSVLEEKYPNITFIQSAVKALHAQSHVGNYVNTC